MTPAVVAVLSALLGPGGSYPPHPAASDTVRTDGVQVSIERALPGHGPGSAFLDVPFVAQGPLLCGGAAAAMVERYWGARGVYGEDYLHLVREAEGGIRASELTRALVDRGFDVQVSRSQGPDGIGGGDGADAALAGAREALEAGIPPILLLESGATQLHYVVLVALEGEAAWIHDPNFGPSRRLSRTTLLQRWEASGYWTALVTPGADVAAPPPAGGGGQATDPAPTREGAGADLPPDPAVGLAMDRIRARDFEGARAAVQPLVQGGGSQAPLGRRILATSWFLEGDRSRALEEWNRLGEPAIDLIVIDGLEHTRHQVALRRMSLTHTDILTPRSLLLARRRLTGIPSVQGARINYQPLPDGTLEVQAAVLERVRVPAVGTLGAQALQGLLNRRAHLEAGPLLAGGDRLGLSGSWQPAQRTLEGSFSAPAPPFPGVVTVTIGQYRERFAASDGGMPEDAGVPPGISTAERSYSSVAVEEWIHPRVRLGADLALETWESAGSGGGRGTGPVRMSGAGLTARLATDDDRVQATARGEGWTGGDASVGRASVQGTATLPRGNNREWRLRGGGIVASREAPQFLWPGAGTGRIRAPLLRAHGLVENDVIQGPAFGRTLLHATAEHRLFVRVGPARLGGTVFVDAAHAGARAGGLDEAGFVDVGLGLFLDSGADEVTLSLARGEAGWRLSVQVGG